MRLRNLSTFVKVAQLESFHAAARQLHATQPAISARIAALEAELGVKLFIRDTGGTRLTARGQQLLPYAEKLVAISREMKNQISEDVPETGNIKVGIADTIAHLWVGPLLSHWREQFPLIEFEIAVDISSRLQKQLENHELDLAIMVAREHTHTTASQPLCSYPQCWVASPELLDRHPSLSGALELDQLARFPILSFPRDTHPWHYLRELFTPLNDRRPMLHTCSSVESLLTLARQGLGITLLPRPLVTEYLKKEQLMELDTAQVPPELNFCCNWRTDDDRILPRLLADSSRDIISTEE
ncbi:LysR family transcriptional regulator [Aestuariicella hydrocarbonica]|uniref:LysR family transcriptional regulator n=1 Tax=Pseudomaricurvus hydrocarbonicus TaxID=1470433 RepID=A0A9E5MNV0_9GAMM|nr:LysR family transcriptional regulator [Aestuariicella hydrocarbonica]NHO67723.1 LysR family transcriptional regulator [Aestuariicella hydrocarbonica]